jgi:hypothetical protein
MHRKTKHSFVWLGVLSILLWFVTTFLMIALYYARGGVAAPTVPKVLPALYSALADSCKSLIFYVIPGLTAGYLFIGLFIFRFVEESKKNGN